MRWRSGSDSGSACCSASASIWRWSRWRFAGLFAGGVALVALLSGDDFRPYLDAGTLQYPIGYRNANAAFFLIAMWPAVALAANRELDWRLRAIALGTATLCLELGALSQSRGSMIGMAVGAGGLRRGLARARAGGGMAARSRRFPP